MTSQPHTPPARQSPPSAQRDLDSNGADDRSPAVTSVVDRFTTEYGAAPDGVWSAPGRINLIGEHTDYNAGFALPIAIDRRTTVAARLRNDGTLSLASTAFSGRVSLRLDELDVPSPAATAEWGWAVHPLSVAWTLTTPEQRRALPGVELMVDSSVPVGAGLSSSHALEVATAGALATLWQVELDNWALVHAVRRAENEFVGAPTGILDQVASVFGQAGRAVLLDCLAETVEQIELRLAPAGLTLLAIDTRTSHAHADDGYADRRGSCERAAHALGVRALREVRVSDLASAGSKLDAETFRRARHIVTENERVVETATLLRAGTPQLIGPLLSASHASMRDDFEISTPVIDLVVNAAMQAGAVGARLTGGGFGGSVIALVREGDVAAITAGVADSLARASLTAPNIFVTTASTGAQRDA